MRYGDAVKQYFSAKGQAVHFPKRGSEDYEAIRTLMTRSGAAAAAAGDATANSAVSAQVAAAGVEKKVRKARPKKAAAAPAPGAPQDTPTKPEGTTLVDQPHVTKQSVAAVVPDAEKPPVKKRKPRAVQADGESPEMNLLKANTVENASMNIVPAAYPGLEGQIKKVLDVRPEGVPTRSEVKTKPEIMTSKTTEGKRTDDAKAIMGRAPFSFSAVKHLLRQ